jgi:hypothetical protein
MIDKEKVIKALELEIKYPYTWDCKSECPYYSDTVCDCYTQLATDAIELMKEQETIVRCKDCKYCEYQKSEKEWCKKGHLHGNAETWFCADGERR